MAPSILFLQTKLLIQTVCLSWSPANANQVALGTAVAENIYLYHNVQTFSNIPTEGDDDSIDQTIGVSFFKFFF